MRDDGESMLRIPELMISSSGREREREKEKERGGGGVITPSFPISARSSFNTVSPCISVNAMASATACNGAAESMTAMVKEGTPE
jgi:hypothetical protein